MSLGVATAGFLIDRLPDSPRMDRSALRELNAIAVEVKALRRELDSMKQAAPPAPETLLPASAEARLVAVERSHARIEAALLASPEKALEMPLLKRDLDQAKRDSAEANAALQREIDRIYDVNKWLMGAMALGVLSLAATQFLGRRDQRKT